jgi:uncharacterized protein YycO
VRWLVSLAIAIALPLVAPGCHESPSAAPTSPVRAGDIVFQTTGSKQSLAIQAATHSMLTHVGMIAHADGHLVVYEAEGTVHTTPLDAWIARAPSTFVVRRLKDPGRFFTPEGTAKLVAASKRFMGRPYDPAFDWSDDKMYCSELVWKTYREAFGLDLGSPRPLRSFDLTSPTVRNALTQRYGKTTIPLDSVMISPQQIFDSELLETVRDDRPEWARDAQ